MPPELNLLASTNATPQSRQNHHAAHSITRCHHTPQTDSAADIRKIDNPVGYAKSLARSLHLGWLLKTDMVNGYHSDFENDLWVAILVSHRGGDQYDVTVMRSAIASQFRATAKTFGYRRRGTTFTQTEAPLADYEAAIRYRTGRQAVQAHMRSAVPTNKPQRKARGTVRG
jgi:hypothetical protein